jgi:hypothetical protein
MFSAKEFHEKAAQILGDDATDEKINTLADNLQQVEIDRSEYLFDIRRP